MTLVVGPYVKSTSPALLRAAYFFEGVEIGMGDILPGENGTAGLPVKLVRRLFTGLKLAKYIKIIH